MRIIEQIFGIVEAEIRAFLREVGAFLGLSSFPFIFSFVAYALGSGMSGKPADPKLLFYQLIGFSMFIIALLMTFSAATFVREGLLTGRLEYLLSAPIHPFVIVVATMISSSLLGLLNYIIIGIVATVLAYDIAYILNFLLSILILYVALLPALGFSMIMLAIGIVVRETEPLSNTITSFIGAVSGLIYPITLLPPILQLIGKAMPYHYAAEYARATIAGYLDLIFKQPFFFLFIYILAGFLVYKYFERAFIKKRGTYGW